MGDKAAEDNIKRVVANVRSLYEQNYTDAQVEAYLKKEGFTPSRFLAAANNFNETGRAYKADGQTAMVQGGTFNLSDEFGAAGNALAGIFSGKNPITEYQKDVSARRSAYHDYTSQHPGEAIAGELAGSLPWMVVPFAGEAKAINSASRAKTLGQQVLAASKAGGIAGAAAGFGAGEGGWDSIKKAVGYGAGGAVLGAAVPPVAQVVGATASRAGQALGISGRDPIARAEREVGRALSRDGMSPQDIRDKMAANAQYGAKPESIADMAGQNTLGTLRTNQAVPSEGKEAAAQMLMDRAAGTRGRVQGDFNAGTQSSDVNVVKLAEDIKTRTRTQAQGAYDSAYMSGRPVDDPRVLEFLQTVPGLGDMFQEAAHLKALDDAMRVATGAQRTPGLVPIVERDAATGAWKATGQFPDTQTLDYLARAMDAKVGSLFANGQHEAARNYKLVREQILSVAENTNPIFKQARAQFRGNREMDEALQSGASVLTQDPRVTSMAMSGMNQAERDMFLLGGRDALRQKLLKTGDFADYGALLRNEDMRRKVQLLFPDEQSFKGFLFNVDRESRMARTKSTVMGGSPTARIQAEQADSAIDPAMMTSLARGDMVGAGGSLASRLYNTARGLTPQSSDEVVRGLLATDPAEVSGFLSKLDGAHAAALKSNARTTGGRAAAGMELGTVPPAIDNLWDDN